LVHEPGPDESMHLLCGDCVAKCQPNLCPCGKSGCGTRFDIQDVPVSRSFVNFNDGVVVRPALPDDFNNLFECVKRTEIHPEIASPERVYVYTFFCCAVVKSEENATIKVEELDLMSVCCAVVKSEENATIKVEELDLMSASRQAVQQTTVDLMDKGLTMAMAVLSMGDTSSSIKVPKGTMEYNIMSISKSITDAAYGVVEMRLNAAMSNLCSEEMMQPIPLGNRYDHRVDPVKSAVEKTANALLATSCLTINRMLHGISKNILDDDCENWGG
jgi:hypothetical protein